MKKIILVLLVLATTLTSVARSRFVTVQGMDLIQPNGEKLLIKGTNLGNWLNPEGYMFGFQRTNAYWQINDAIAEMVGPDEAAAFWQTFKDNYITEADIAFIAEQGANTIRLPFNYKSFTDEDYMGLTGEQDGFARVDRLVEWCKKHGLYLILDMHDCPGGQTGDNIDNSYGYPWLFESEVSQQRLCDIWRQIARHYRNEPTILAYEIMNEPIAHYFKDDLARLNAKLEPLYKRATKTIREVDKNHVIMLGGAQWNGNFEPFTDWTFDTNIMYTCHRYGGDSDQKAYQSLIDFRDRTGLPMYMGETGHNSDEWQTAVAEMLERNNIGYTFWPYKKVDGSCMNGVRRPEGWDSIVVRFAEADRMTFQQIRDARPDQQTAQRLLREYLENVKCENCMPQTAYIRTMRMK